MSHEPTHLISALPKLLDQHPVLNLSFRQGVRDPYGNHADRIQRRGADNFMAVGLDSVDFWPNRN